MIRFRTSVVIALLGAMSLSQPASADALLDKGLAKMAGAIRKFLDDEGLSRHVIVGEFPGVPNLEASGGVEIARSIEAELRKAGVKVSDDATIQVMGKFRLQKTREFPQDRFESLALKIDALILDDLGDELADLPISVFGSVALQMAGVDVDLPPDANPKEVEQAKIDQVRKPKTVVRKPARGEIESEAKASDASLFGLEIMVHSANELVPRKLTKDSRGRAFVDLHKGEEYVVRIHNHASFEAAVELTIDGVNAFALAKDVKQRSSMFVVQPNSSTVVPGWFRDLATTNAFEIGGFRGSVAEQQGASANKVGVVTAKFRASFGEGVPRPSDEPGDGARRKDASPPGKATVLGRELKKTYNQVKREFGVVRSVVNIRYDK